MSEGENVFGFPSDEKNWVMTDYKRNQRWDEGESKAAFL